MADSLWEYFPKQHMMLGGLMNQYRELYEDSIEVVKKHIFYRPMTEKNDDILLSGNARVNADNLVTQDSQGQHLACFTGGMVGIAAQIFDRPQDLAMARKLVDGCIWAYRAMPSGLMPETFHTVPCRDTEGCTWDKQKWYSEVNRVQKEDDMSSKLSGEERSKYFIKREGLPPGFTAIGDTRYILR